MASRQDGITQLYDLPQGGGPERLPQPEKTAAVRVKASRAAAVFLTMRFILNFSFISVVYRLFLHQDTKMPGA